MKIDAQLVSHVARLAALRLTPTETEEMSSQLTRIVEHFEALRAIPEELLAEEPDAPPMALRDDVVTQNTVDPGAIAPEYAHGHFVVPRVVSRGE